MLQRNVVTTKKIVAKDFHHIPVGTRHGGMPYNNSVRKCAAHAVSKN